MNAPSPLLALVALLVTATPALAETYTMATSWSVASNASQIFSDGSTLYLQNPSGVSHYDATGGLIGSWSPLNASSIVGFDAANNPLLAEPYMLMTGGVTTTIRAYTPGGTPLSTSEFAAEILAVDRQGYGYGPGLDFGIAKYAPDGSPAGDFGAESGLLGIAWDETLIGIQLNDPDITVGWFTTAVARLGTVPTSICREGFEPRCSYPFSATTDGHGGAFIAASWHEPAPNPDGYVAGQSVDHYDGGSHFLGRFASFGRLATDSQGAIYVLDSGVVEKWVLASTPVRTISWGAVKARYAR